MGFHWPIFSHVLCSDLEKKIGDADNLIPDTRSLVTKTILNIKINEVQDKILNHTKYITTQNLIS